jgi:hypothetical protein
MFAGEMMDCISCGFSQESDPKIESGWTMMLIGDETKYICPTCCASPYPTSTPRCAVCNKYYESHYNSCPHCLKSKAIEELKAQMMTIIKEADGVKKTPVFEIPENFLAEAISALKDLKPEFEKRELFPVIKLDNDSITVNGFTSLVLQNFILAQKLSKLENTPHQKILKWVIAVSKRLNREISPLEIAAMFDDYKTLVDEVSDIEERVNQDNN